MPHLLAIDVGLRCGLALFDLTPRLRWYRSRHFRNAAALRRAAPQILAQIDSLQTLVLEGGGNLADPWRLAAERRGLNVRIVGADIWRRDLLLQREQRGGAQAKRVADRYAREIIADAQLPRPTSLRHDAAEAILVGWWALHY